MAAYLVFLEQRDGILAEASVNLWHRVQHHAVPGADRVSGFVAGPLRPGALEPLFGAGVVHHAAEERLARSSETTLSRLLAALAAREAITDIVIASTSAGKRLAPCLAQATGASLLSGCVAGGFQEPVCRRPIHCGSILVACVPEAPVRIYLQDRLPQVLFTGTEHPRSVAFDIVPHLDADEKMNPAVRSITEISRQRDISEAGIIVAGGRGMGGPEGFLLLEKLAALLGGSVGASRSAVDEGWRPHGDQIGQTGKSVSPDLYIAAGISGALQHLAGLSAARTIVAINADPDAPVFGVADYGIVGDVLAVLPRLIDVLGDVLPKK